ncbi:hypothetical protein HI914_06348 [Erysiphe necator]|nr:hypothetical protein HI914_06348 [Erysiphe necator]
MIATTKSGSALAENLMVAFPCSVFVTHKIGICDREQKLWDSINTSCGTTTNLYFRQTSAFRQGYLARDLESASYAFFGVLESNPIICSLRVFPSTDTEPRPKDESSEFNSTSD